LVVVVVVVKELVFYMYELVSLDYYLILFKDRDILLPCASHFLFSYLLGFGGRGIEDKNREILHIF